MIATNHSIRGTATREWARGVVSRARPVIVLIVALAAPALVANPAPAAPAADATPVPFTNERLLVEIGREFEAHFKLEGEWQLELLRSWTPRGRPADGWVLQMLEFPPAPASSMIVRCRVTDASGGGGDFTLLVKASCWREVWVARQPMAVGAALEPAGCEARRVDVLRERDAVPVTGRFANHVFVRSVAAGRVVTWRDLTRRPLVRKGELIEVQACEGPLLITLKAIAMENGAQGETVVLRNPESRKNFSALVIDENRVQVRF